MTNASSSTWRKGLRVATEIIGKLPARGEGPIHTIIKLLGIADTVHKHFWNERTPALYEHFEELGADVVASQQFVDLFFSTPLRDLFILRRLAFTENATVIHATHPKGKGSLYFSEWSYGFGKPTIASEFWHTKGFDFVDALATLWGAFEGRIHVSLVRDRTEYRTRAVYTKIPALLDPLLGGARERLDDFVASHKAYLVDGVPRTYLLVGPPGGGKTSFAMHVAAHVGGRALRIEASGLTATGAQELDFLIESLQPSVVIVDDLDRAADLETSLPTLFSILTDFKGKHPKTTVVLTVNDLTKLDAALLRPGRVDEIYRFDAPDQAARRDLLAGYFREFGISADVEPFLEPTAGLTGAYLREIALQCRYKGPAGSLALVEQMKTIAEQKKAAQAPPPPKPTV
jgi:ATPase family associated with various cellular activities (AAA)